MGGKSHMNYAPVIIPTLNRKHHLKRCIKSLAENKEAQFTEIYISVDYPPNDKYTLGYDEVKEWLNSIGNYGFKAIHVFYQEENLGPKANVLFLQDVVKEVSDRYILTEDDNEFSKNFLEYMNLCLEFFESDKKVMGICASKSAEWISENNGVVYSKIFSAYGFGTWSDIDKKLETVGAEVILSKKTLKFGNLLNLYKKNKALFVVYICDVLCKDEGIYWEGEKLFWCDTLRGIYLHLTDDVCIMPVARKSRTWGNDGSGINMKATDTNPEVDMPLDKKDFFIIDSEDKLYFDEQNYKVGERLLGTWVTWKSVLKACIYYILLLVVGKDRYKAVKILKKLRRFNNER